MFPIGFPASTEFPGCISLHCVFIYPKSKFRSLPGPPVPQPPPQQLRPFVPRDLRLPLEILGTAPCLLLSL